MTTDEQHVQAIKAAHDGGDVAQLMRVMADAIRDPEFCDTPEEIACGAVLDAATQAWPGEDEPDRDDPAGRVLWAVAEFARLLAAALIENGEDQ